MSSTQTPLHNAGSRRISFVYHPLARAALLCIAACTVPALAAAQAAPAADSSQATLPEVKVQASLDDPAVTEGTGSYTTGATSTATKLDLSIRETPQSVSVVTRQRMDDQAMLSIRDVLNNTTGVSTHQLDSDRVTFYARGFPIDNFQYDGIPTTFDTTYSFGDTALDTAFYDRIEVVRGATGLMTGFGNPSAAVNLVRKRPTRTFAASASLSAGSWDNYRAEADVSSPLTPDGRIRGRVVAAYQNANSYIDLYKQDKRLFYGVVDADLTRNTTLTVGMDYQKTKPRGTTWGGFPLFYSDGTRTDFDRSVTTAANWSGWDTESKTMFVNLEHRFDNGWKARAAYSHAENDYDAKLLWLTGYPDRVTGLGMTAGSAARFIGNRQQNSVDLNASGPFQLFGRTHELVVGYSGSHQRANNPAYYPTGAMPDVGNFFAWNGSYPQPDFSTISTGGDFSHTEQSGFYAATRVSITDPLKVIGGLRVGSWKTDAISWGVRDQFKYDNEVTPYAGILYDITRNLTAYASYTKIFNPQKLQDRNGRYLDPVSGTNYEVGLKGEFFDGKLNSSLALFDLRQDNVGQIDPGVILPSGAQAYYAAQGTRTRGFELDVSGQITQGWQVYAGYSHHTSSDATGAPVNTQVPRTLLRLFTTYRLPGDWNKLVVGGGVNWQSRIYSTVSAPQGEVVAQQGAYALVNLMARYQISRQLSATLNLNNLFDKKYYGQVGFYSQGFYGAPRNAMLTLRYQH